MKNAYQKPNAVIYNKEDVLELMGPVKTQYLPQDEACLSCNNVSLSPSAVLQGKVVEQMGVSVGTLNCPDFAKVQITVPGSSPFIYYELDRSEGSESPSGWSAPLEGFQFLGERGSYQVEVVLMNADSSSGERCYTTIELQ